LKPEIKKYFQFSRRERNGVFLLLFVLIGVILLRYAFPLLLKTDREEVIITINTAKSFDDTASKSGKSNRQEFNYTLKPFNPNTASKDSLILAGVSPKLAQQIVNYRNAGGRFKIKKDFAKLYYVTDSSYKVYEPFLLLPETLPKPKPIHVELNTADSLQLLSVKGIGPFYAHKILKYRRESGGFFTIDQLGEAFYIRANTLEEQQSHMRAIKKKVWVNPKKIKPFNINTATQKQLSHHPYISYRQSQRILTLRKKSRIEGWDILIDKHIFTTEEKKLLVYYLTFK
jgi:DNA uptake protein ComE-like DNA-binding protein